MSKIPYEKAVGSLMYLMICTRPDIALAMGKVSRYMSNPGKIHWEAVKWILRYLKGTTDFGLVFDSKLHNAKSVIGYVDADYGQDLDGRKSTTGYVFTLGGGCISWRSTLQKCVAQSTTEAEYVAVAEAAKEAVWLDKLVTEMGLPHDIVNLHCDSQSALHLAVNQMMNCRVKHIDIRYHFLRQVVFDKMIELVKIDGKLNPSDALTKVIPLESFLRHRAMLQVLHMGHK
jgi:ATP-binding cassette subfamily B (MDR/TAP) protein 1